MGPDAARPGSRLVQATPLPFDGRVEDRFDVSDRSTVQRFQVADVNPQAVDGEDLDAVQADRVGRLLQILRRGKHGLVRVGRAMIIMASASGTPVTAIARLVVADEDTVRDVIHLFNQKGLAALAPQ